MATQPQRSSIPVFAISSSSMSVSRSAAIGDSPLLSTARFRASVSDFVACRGTPVPFGSSCGTRRTDSRIRSTAAATRSQNVGSEPSSSHGAPDIGGMNTRCDSHLVPARSHRSISSQPMKASATDLMSDGHLRRSTFA
jgi:hypothetical protein